MKNMKIEVGELSEKDKDERRGYPVKIKPKFKNMKIEINAEQPLGEVCGELERLGYIHTGLSQEDATNVFTWDNGFNLTYTALKAEAKHLSVYGNKTTLTKLKAMGREDD